MPLGKHAGQRIKENLAVAVAYGEAIRFQLLQEGAPDRPFIAGDDSPDYVLFHATHASNALTLRNHEFDAAIAKGFAEAKLDPENPWHWRALLFAFAEAYYPRKNSNQFWTLDRLTRLAAQELRIKIVHPKWTQDQYHKALTKWVAKQYGKQIESSSVLRLLRQARDRKKNPFLDSICQEIEREWAERMGKYKSKFKDPDSVIQGMRGHPSTVDAAIALADARLRSVTANLKKDHN